MLFLVLRSDYLDACGLPNAVYLIITVAGGEIFMISCFLGNYDKFSSGVPRHLTDLGSGIKVGQMLFVFSGDLRG